MNINLNKQVLPMLCNAYLVTFIVYDSLKLS